MSEDDLIEYTTTSITETTFQTQPGWVKEVEEDDGEEFWYWILPLPHDTKIKDGPCLMSSANDEFQEYSLKEGEYLVRLFVPVIGKSDTVFELGICTTEEEIEILYRALMGKDLE